MIKQTTEAHSAEDPFFKLPNCLKKDGFRLATSLGQSKIESRVDKLSAVITKVLDNSL